MLGQFFHQATGKNGNYQQMPLDRRFGGANVRCRIFHENPELFCTLKRYITD